jgi:hypothetical protein
MAALRRAPDIDQWRPEESSNRERERPRERPRERINDSRASSPAPRAARDSSRHRAPNTDNRQHARARSRERSLSRERTRRRSRSISREDRFRGNRREASADRVAHSRHHSIVETPPQPLAISKGLSKARKTSTKPQHSPLQVENAACRFDAPACESILSTTSALRSRTTTATTHARHIHTARLEPSAITLARYAL